MQLGLPRSKNGDVSGLDTVPSHQTEKDFEAMHRAKGFMQAVLPGGLDGYSD